MQKLVISAPFGNYVTLQGATSTLGTFTLRRRGGTAYRLWRCLLTLRYDPSTGDCTNRLGLPNPGLAGCRGTLTGRIVSVRGGFERWDWSMLVNAFVGLPVEAVELNLSCPNAAEMGYSAVSAAELGLAYKIPLIAKLPPVRWESTAAEMYAAGVRHFHCCNTLPVKGGGLSGPKLKPYSLAVVRALRERYGDTVGIIGGGGVSRPEDAMDYLDAGADRVAVASALLNPFGWYRIRRLRDRLQQLS